MNELDVILTNYPLSRDFEGKLAAIVAPNTLKLSVSELRQRSFSQMVRYMRSLKANRLLLPIEDENGSALLPVLKLLASVVPAQSIYHVQPDLKLHRISRLEVALSLVRLVHASLTSRLATERARREVKKLLCEKRVKVVKQTTRQLLYLNANLWFGVKAGGSVGHISGVVNALTQNGYLVDFASCGGRLLVSDTVRYTKLNPPEFFGLPWELNYYRFHFKVVDQVKKLEIKQGFNFIYQRLSIANYSGVVLSRILGIPLILEYNGSEAWIARNWGRLLREQSLAEQVETLNLNHAHLIVTISDVLRDELVGRGLDPNRIVTYPNCIDPLMFDPARFSEREIREIRHRHGVKNDEIVVAFVGTFGQWHGAEILAEAIRRLLSEHESWIEQSRVHFMLIGDGLKMPEVKNVLGKFATGRHVTLTGLIPQHEAPLYLAASDILSSPHVPNSDGSKFFGSPTKLFEYMAMGKAIVASNLDQIGEVLTPSLQASELSDAKTTKNTGQLAILCRPGSVDEQMDAIRFLVDNPAWRQELGMRARAKALTRFTWAHHVQAIISGLENEAYKN